jgi:cytochrome b
MALSQQEKALRRREGNPNGTYFVVAALIALAVAVGTYFFIMQSKEIEQSNILKQETTEQEPAPDATIN